MFTALHMSFGALRQQIPGDAQPFLGKRLFADSFCSPAIPIACISPIAFFAMQIGMNPRAVGPFIILSTGVRALPIASRIPPQSG